MKKKGLVYGVVMMLLILGLTLPVFGQEKAKGEAKAGLSIARLVVGTGVQNKEPVGAAETFPATTEKVYCFIEAKDIPKDLEVTVVWYNNQKELSKFSLPLKMGSRWRTFAEKNVRGLKGEWKVEVKDAEGKALKEAKFKVE
jgi:hypothetical protein